MSDINMEKFAVPDFVPERYVKELAKSCVGGEELTQQKDKIQTLAEETASALKKNVYENYMQFIETATEISHLEAEMYKLSHLLSEQRTVLTTLSHASVLGNENNISRESLDNTDLEAERAEEQRKNKLNLISEKVESCMNLLDVPERTLLHEGDLLEIDAEENTALQRMHVYLFNDCLMLTSWISNRRGPMRYKFQASYPISTLAVVNVRDLGTVKQAFKVLAFPDTRVFQCNSLAIKKDWLEKFDVAKKMHIEKENSIQKKKESQEKPKAELMESPSLSVEELPSPQVAPLPEWLADVTEELDVLIVERHFQKTYELMVLAQKALSTDEFKSHPQRAEILKKIEQKQKALIEILLKELDVTHNWSPRGGLRSSRYPVLILNKFNMTSQACELFLAICSHTVKVHVKGVQLEGSINSYVKQVGEVFFCSLSDALTEFISLFPKNKVSAFVVWASMQLRILMSQLIKQVFTPQCPLESILECVQSLREQCTLFCEFGLDLRFQMNSCLRSPIIKALREYKEKIVDSMKTKVAEDKWTPVAMHTKLGVQKFLAQMENLGLILAKFIINETWVDLSSSTIWFAQSVITVQKVGLELVTKDMMDVLDECIYAIFNARLMLSLGNDSSYAQNNYKFILDTVLPMMLRRYREDVGYENEKLTALAKKFGVNVVPPKKSNITKYTSNEYL
ncbi:exocyst complex component 8 [Pectinophora gossypiella]|uniref:exocyst complex component 8 n=1 Tax=Pectinophora gossypiella TaxID=13191 RepID=UPI00214F5A34|nr:exocyst complex component 8 [Pectinophora gossypiella]